MTLSTFASLAGPILDLIRRAVPDRDEQARLEAALAQAIAQADARLAEAQSLVVKAEAGGNWLQRSWRPIFMWLCMGLLIWHAVAMPVLAVALGVPLTDMVGLDHVPDGLWTLLVVGMGGYIGGRSVEKVLAGKR